MKKLIIFIQLLLSISVWSQSTYKTLQFDGTSQYLKVSDKDSLELGNSDFTISMWVNFAAFPNTSPKLVSKWQSEGEQRSYTLFYKNDNNTLTFSCSSDGTDFSMLTYEFPWQPLLNTWYHIALQRSSGDLEAFVNGSKIGTTQNIATLSIFNSSSDLLIGNTENAAEVPHNFFLNGSLSSIKVVKTSGIVSKLYNSGTPKVHEAYSSLIKDSCVLAIEGAEDLPTTIYESDFNSINTRAVVLDADNVEFNNNQVTKWLDSSGNGEDAIPENTSPTISASTLNKKRLISFSNDRMSNSSALIATGNSDRTVIYVADSFDTISSDIAVNLGYKGSAVNNEAFGITDTTIYGGKGANDITGLSSFGSRGQNGKQIFSIIYKDGKISRYRNGIKITDNVQGRTLNTLSGFMIGDWPDRNRHFNGDIAQVSIFSEALDGSTQKDVENLLIARYFPLKDLSSSRNHSTPINTPTLTGEELNFSEEVSNTISAKSLELNGTDQYLEVVNEASITLTDDFTYTAWVNPADLLSYHTILSRYNSTGNQRAFAIQIGPTSGLLSVVTSTNGSNVIGHVSNISIPANSWTFVTFRMSGGNIYLSKNSETEQSFSQASLFSGNSSTFIGAHSLASEPFKGSISSVMAFNSAITPENISELYNSGIPKQPWQYSQGLLEKMVLALPLNVGLASGRELEDFSGNENDAVLVNSPTLTGLDIQIEKSEKVNTAKFNGTNAYINCGNNSSLQITDEITVSAWIKFDNLGIPFSKYSFNNNQRAWYLRELDGKYAFLVSPDGITPTEVKSTSNIDTNSFIHIVGIYNGEQIKIYVNGVEEGAVTYSGGILNSSADVIIGSYGGVNLGHGPYDGDLTSPMIFNRALTDSEIALLYNQNLPKPFASLPSSIKDSAVLALDLTSNDISLIDLSGNGNNGTNSGVSFDGTEIDIDSRITELSGATLEFHLEADTGISDKSANGHIITNLNNTQIIPAAVNGHSVIRFNGSNQALTANDVTEVFNSGEPFEIAIVLKDNVTTSYSPAISWVNNNDDAYSSIDIRDSDTVNGNSFSYEKGAAGNNNQELFETTDIGAGFAVVYARYDGRGSTSGASGTIGLKINDLDEVTLAVDQGHLDNTFFSIGALVRSIDTGGTAFFNGDIAEIKIYSGERTVEERNAESLALMTKYDINLKPLEISSDLTISAGDTSLDGRALIVQDSTLTVDGSHTFKSLTLINSTLTHSPSTDLEINSLELTIEETLDIDATSKIDVSGKGLPAGYTWSSEGPTITGASTSNAGGSYGGLGHNGEPSGVVTATYGVILNPSEPGSGSGLPDGSAGGGLIRITAPTLILDGEILANGASNNSGGSGGGIFIDVNQLETASPHIEANGGLGNSLSGYGAGGGGRIALYFKSLVGSLANSRITAAGGKENSIKGYQGQDGTVYIQSNENPEPISKITVIPTDNSFDVTWESLYPGEITGYNIYIDSVLRDTISDPQIKTSTISSLSTETVYEIRILALNSEGEFGLPVLKNAKTLAAAGSPVITINVNTEVPQENLTFDGKDLIVDGTVLTMDGEHSFRSLQLINGAQLKHTAATETDEFKLDLYVAEEITIDSTSSIDVSGKGFLPGYIWSEYTGMTSIGIGTGRSGGSYGGYGGGDGGASNEPYGDYTNPNALGAGGVHHTSLPAAGEGGGLVRLVANSLILDGAILSNGTAPNDDHNGGGGSGGGIKISVNDLSYTTSPGTIHANGAISKHDGAGGGGRIAIYYSTGNFTFDNVRASGGYSRDSNEGGVGTVYIVKDGEKPLFKFHNNDQAGRVTPIWFGKKEIFSDDPQYNENNFQVEKGADVKVLGLSPLRTENLTIEDSGSSLEITYTELSENLTVDGENAKYITDALTVSGNVTLKNGAILTSLTTTETIEHRLTVSANEITVDSESSIDLTGKGYPSGYGYSAFGPRAYLPTENEVGGSYGGYGGTYTDEVTEPYGDFQYPNELGSGGSQGFGIGGGLVHLEASKLTLNGSIIANGSYKTHSHNWGGSGGGIYIDVDELIQTDSTASIEAVGHSVQYDYSGAGGRIAIYYNNGGFDINNINAHAGAAGRNYQASNGTVYLKPDTEPGTLKFGNNGKNAQKVTPLWFGIRDDNTDDPLEFSVNFFAGNRGELNIESDTIFKTESLSLNASSYYLHVKNLQVQNDVFVQGENAEVSSLSISTSQDVKIHGTNATLNVDTLEAGKIILTSGAVLSSNNTTSEVEHKLLITANEVLVSSDSRIDVSGKGYLGGYKYSPDGPVQKIGNESVGGGSYGGQGANQYGFILPTYGDFLNPNELGGGGHGSYGRGGGLVRLTANKLILDGQILANGLNGTQDSYAGAGGGIFIDVDELSQNITGAKIKADASYIRYDWAAGGGRVAVYYDSGNFEFDEVTALASQGNRTGKGTDGTVYIQKGNVPSTLSDFSATPALTSIDLNWQYRFDSPDFTQIKIYQNGLLLTSLPKSNANFTAENLSEGTYYNFRIVSTNDNGDEGNSYSLTVKTISSEVRDEFVVNTNGQIFEGGDLNIQNKDLVIDGASLTLNGNHQLKSLVLKNNATLTHSNATSSEAYSANLNILGDVTVEAGSKIDVTGRGYPAAHTKGENGPVHIEHTAAFGGSYGGRGHSAPSTNDLYGNFKQPRDLGSGGQGYSGGGAIEITCENLLLFGSILADGTRSAYKGGSAGSGGSIYLKCDTIETDSAVSISANGGHGGGYSNGRGGGGGRIAIEYDRLIENGEVKESISEASLLTVIARGGSGANAGAGTIYLKKTNSIPELIIKSTHEYSSKTYVWFNDRDTFEDDPISEDMNIIVGGYGLLDLEGFTKIYGGNVEIKGSSSVAVSNLEAEKLLVDASKLHVNELVIATNISLINESTLQSYQNTANSLYSLNIHTDKLFVEAGSEITTTGQGLPVNYMWSTPYPIVDSITSHHGGTYAGVGASGETETYGNPRNPYELGSGGSNTPGGGSIRILANEINLQGSISSGGTSSTYYGAGSGGSVLIHAGNIIETYGASISANGGGSHSTHGGTRAPRGGGGGRVAIYYNTSEVDFANSSQISVLANGGSAATSGADGSVYIAESNANQYIIDFSPRSIVKDASEIQVRFAAPVDEISLATGDFSVTGPNGAVNIISIDHIAGTKYKISTDPLEEGAHTVTVGPDISSTDGFAMDTDGNGTPGEPTDVFTFNFTLDTTAPLAPLISSHAPVGINKEITTSITVEGDREDGDKILINGVEYADFGNGPWSANITLPQGESELLISAIDAAGNVSPDSVLVIDVDSIAPTFSSTSPINGAFVSQLQDITVQVTEDGSGIDLENIPFSVVRDGSVTVNLNESIVEDTVTLSSSGFLLDGSYVLSGNLVDGHGNSTAVSLNFTVDGQAPAIVDVGQVPEVIITNSHTFNGTKESHASVYLNGIQIIASNTSTTWTYTKTNMLVGDNLFSFTQKDRAANESDPLLFSINYDDTVPGIVDPTLNGVFDGFTVSLDWATYDEVINGNDIAGYDIYQSTASFTNIADSVKVATTQNKTYSLSELNRGETYYFAVVAFDARGNHLEEVVSKSVMTSDNTAPVEVSNVSINSNLDSVTISWNHLDTDLDIDRFLVYEEGNATPFTVTNAVRSITFNSLNKESIYNYTIASVDADDNVSSGKAVTAYTLVDNPTIITSEPRDGKIRLQWTPAADESLLSHYKVYVSHTNYQTLGTQAHVKITTTNTIDVPDLLNGTTYFLTVTAVNKSGNEDRENITVISASPSVDEIGPSFNSLTFNSAAITNGSTLTTSGTIQANVSDQSGIARVEFSFDGGSVATDVTGPDYTWFFNIEATTDASHTLKFTTYDLLGNKSETTLNLIVAMSAPTEQPSITSPLTGFISTNETVIVQGAALPKSKMNFYNNGQLVASNMAVSTSGEFASGLSLAEGDNIITAKLTNRGGEGPVSNSVTVTLDTTKPKAPINVTATPDEEGQVKLTWQNGGAATLKGFKLYRSNTAFTAITDNGVTQVGSLINAFNYQDLPSQDGTYFYRISAVNTLDTEGPLSTIVSSISDSTPPKAVSIVYTPIGPYDSASGRYGKGAVQVRLTVSEELLTTPFLALTPEGGSPMTVLLNKISETVYEGAFTISSSTVSGTAHAVLSARDLVGNRGNEIDSGTSIIVDTEGPLVQSITENSGKKLFPNDPANPTSLTFTAVLDAATEGDPEFKWLMSKADPVQDPLPVENLIKLTTTSWSFTITLPATAGASEDDYLRISYRGEDDLENTSTKINGLSEFLVYQGDLPALDTPLGFTGKSLPGGEIELNWQAVEGAADYEVYRGTTAGNLALIIKTGNTTTYTDLPPVDGTYFYAVKSVRVEDEEEALSEFSDTLSFISDRLAPPAPTDLLLSLTGRGILLEWTAPQSPGETITYGIYRSSEVITDVSELTAVGLGISQLSVIDPNPQTGIGNYTVVSVDTVGNISVPADSQYLNFELLPVNSLEISRSGNDAPLLKWTHSGGASIQGYSLLINGTPADNTGLKTGLEYNDHHYPLSSERFYTVTAVDNADVESPSRSINLPLVNIDLNAEESLRRGIMNSLIYTVENQSSFDISGAKLQVQVAGRDHSSDAFTVKAGEAVEVSVVIGGYSELQDSETLVNTFTYSPNPGEKVSISDEQSISVTDSSLVAEILNDEIVRGTFGQAKFRIHNNSEVEMQIVTARSSGQVVSNQLRMLLKDIDGNVLSSVPFQIATGNNLFTLSTGEVVAAIPPGESFISNEVQIFAPETATENAILQLEIDNFYHNRSRDNEVQLSGLKTTKQISLLETEYTGIVDAITPAISTGQNPIVITGRAVNRETEESLPDTNLTLGISVDGFDRQYDITTDGNGNFSYTFTPATGEAGVYFVWLRHPDSKDKVLQDSFTIQNVSWTPGIITARLPFEYQSSARVTVRTGKGTVLNNVRLEPVAAIPQGVNITLPQNISKISGNSSANINFTISAESTAATEANIVYNVVSDEQVWGTVTLDLSFYTQTVNNVASLQFDKNVIKTGVKYGNLVGEEFSITSNGLIPVNNINIELLKSDGSALTAQENWIALTSQNSITELPVGQSSAVGINFAPSNAVPPGFYEFKVRLTSDNYPKVDFPVYVTVTDSALGNALFKVTDMYTLSLDPVSGNLIEGVNDAEIFLQYTVDPTQTHTVRTDITGEYLVRDLSVGIWKYRITKAAHDTFVGTLEIKPGITELAYVGLKDQLISVSWSVKPITIVDRYDIELNTTFVTNVPAAVVRAEPASISIPAMEKGDVFTAEVTYTNLGFINAEGLELNAPKSTSQYNYEILNNLPTTIPAGESARLVYRITCLTDGTEFQNGTGGGTTGTEHNDDSEFARIEYDLTLSETKTDGNCNKTNFWTGVKYRYKCPNEVEYTDVVPHNSEVSYKVDGCGISDGTGGVDAPPKKQSSGGSGGTQVSVPPSFFIPTSFSGGNFTPPETLDEDGNECISLKWKDSGSDVDPIKPAQKKGLIKPENWTIIRAAVFPEDKDISYEKVKFIPFKQDGNILGDEPKLITVQPNGKIPYATNAEESINDSDFPILIMVAGKTAGNLTFKATSGKEEIELGRLVGSCFECGCEGEENKSNDSSDAHGTQTNTTSLGGDSSAPNMSTNTNFGVNQAGTGFDLDSPIGIPSITGAKPGYNPHYSNVTNPDGSTSSNLDQVETPGGIANILLGVNGSRSINFYDKSAIISSGVGGKKILSSEAVPREKSVIRQRVSKGATTSANVDIVNVKNGEVNVKSYQTQVTGKTRVTLIKTGTVETLTVEEIENLSAEEVLPIEETEDVEQITTTLFDNGGWERSRLLVGKPLATGTYEKERFVRLADGSTRIVLKEEISNGILVSTTYDYVWDIEDAAFGRLLSWSSSIGDFVKYEYDSQGRITKELTDYLGSTIEQPEEVHSVTAYTYDNNELEESEPSSVIVYTQGNITSKIWFEYSLDKTTEIVAVSPLADKNDQDNLITETTYYPQYSGRYSSVSKESTFQQDPGGYFGKYAGRTRSVTYPDGQRTFFSYESTDGLDIETMVTGYANEDGNIFKGSKTIKAHDDDLEISCEIYSIFEYNSQIHEELLEAYTCQYDSQKRLLRKDFHDGTSIVNTYDCCNLQSEKSRAGIVTSFHYEDGKRVETTVNGITSKDIFDEEGNLQETRRLTDNGGEQVDQLVTRYFYDEDTEDITSSENFFGHKTHNSTTIAEDGTVTKIITHPNDSTNTTVTDRDGNILQTINRLGQTTNFIQQYENDEELGYAVLLNAAEYKGLYSKTYINFQGKVFKTVTAEGRTTRNYHNRFGDIIRTVDSDGSVTLYQYDQSIGLSIEALDVNKNGIIDYGVDVITRTQNDIILDEENRAWERERFWFKPTSLDNPGAVEVTELTALDRMEAKTIRLQGGTTSSSTVKEFDEDGILTLTSTSYNKDGSYMVRVTVNGFEQSVTLFDQNDVQQATKQYLYDHFNRVEKVIDSRNGTTTYVYDELDRIKEVITEDPDDDDTTNNTGLKAQSIKTFYNKMGLREKVINPDLTEVHFEYNKQDQLEKVYGSNVYTRKHIFDEFGRIVNLITWRDEADDATRSFTSWTYDNDGYILSKSDNTGKTLRYEYDDLGRLRSRTDSRNISKTYYYDDAARVDEVNYNDGTHPVSVTYNLRGQVETVSDAAGERTLNFDNVGRYTGADWNTGAFQNLNQTYAYDNLGRLDSFTWSLADLNKQTGYDYDDLGRLQKITSGNHSYQYSYQQNAPFTVENVEYFNGLSKRLSTSRSFDKLMRTEQFTVQGASDETLQQETFTHNDLNQRDTVTLLDGSKWVYAYDAKGNLESAVKKDNQGNDIPEYTFNYTFDALGNRLTASEGNKSTTYTPNSLNQYSDIDIDGLLVQHEYDSEGNLTNDGSWHYLWDAENRLAVMYDKNETVLLEFTYDYQDFRTSKKIYNIQSGWAAPSSYSEYSTANLSLLSNTGFVYDGSLITAEIDFMNSGSLLRSYTWGLDISSRAESLGGAGALLAQEDSSGNVYYYTHNAGGNVSKLINSGNGNILNNYEYGPSGQVLVQNESVTNPFRYNSKYHDDETGLIYYGYRYYSSDLGRWLNQDPLGESGGVNLYAANNNDSINNIDPYGLSSISQDSNWSSSTNTTADEKKTLGTKELADNDVYKPKSVKVSVLKFIGCLRGDVLAKAFGKALIAGLAAYAIFAVLPPPISITAGVILSGIAAYQFIKASDEIAKYAKIVFQKDCECWTVQERRQVSELIGDIFGGLVTGRVTKLAGKITGGLKNLAGASIQKLQKLVKKKTGKSIPEPKKNYRDIVDHSGGSQTGAGLKVGGDRPVPKQKPLKNVTETVRKKSGSKSDLEVNQKIDKPKYAPNLKKWRKKGGKVKQNEDGSVTYTDWEGNSVTYKNNKPDFGPHTNKEVDIDMKGDHYHDYKAANSEAGYGDGAYDHPDGTTWHHHENKTTMQNIDTDIHDRFTHQGGVSELKGDKK